MKILRNKQIKAGLMLMTFAILVMAANRNNEISTLNGPLILNASTSGVYVEKQLNVSAGIYSQGTLNLKVSDDTDDYLSFSTVSNQPHINIEGGNLLRFSSSTAGGDTSNVKIQLALDDGISRVRIYDSEGTYGEFTKSNNTDTGYPNDINIYNSDSDGTINILPNNDGNDYLSFSTVGNIPYINREGGSNLYYQSSQDIGEFRVCSSGACLTDDFFIIMKYNQTEGSGYQDSVRIRDSGVMNFQPNNDNDDYLKFSTSNNRPIYSSVGSGGTTITADNNITRIGSTGWLSGDVEAYIQFAMGDGEIYPSIDNAFTLGKVGNRWSDVRSVLINGADMCFMNNVCMTECENSQGQLDICFVYGKPTNEQAHKIAVTTIGETYQDYINAHMIEEDYVSGQVWDNETETFIEVWETRQVFDESLTEQEFNTIKAETITANGNYDFTFGRTVRLSMRDVKETIERLDDIEQTLCDQGLNKYC